MNFNEYYQNIFGDQWTRLLEGLHAPTKKVALRAMNAKSVDKTYELDVASLAPSFFLPMRDGIRVLDMCAAPGGKSLCLLERTNGQMQLVASDLSVARVSRLKKVLMEHTPEEWHKNILVLCRDGNHFGLREKDSYDVVLLDAPCSSERHVLGSPKDLKDWSVKRIKGLKLRQHSLLCSALAAVREGGYVSYSTCALVPDENDGVIARLHESREGQFEVIKNLEGFDGYKDADGYQGVDTYGGFESLKAQFESRYNLKIEATEYGHQILPWKNENTGEAPGPLYWCLLRKI